MTPLEQQRIVDAARALRVEMHAAEAEEDPEWRASVAEKMRAILPQLEEAEHASG